MSYKLSLDFSHWLLDFPRLIAVISTAGVVLAFFYEAAYSFGIGISMGSVLQAPDLIRTSVFVISFLSSFYVAVIVFYLSGAVEGRGLDIEKLAEEHRKQNLLPKLLFFTGLIDFLLFLALGGFFGVRIWPVILAAFIAMRLSSAVMGAVGAGFFERLFFFSLLFLAAISFQKGLSNSDFDARQSNLPIAVATEGNGEWRVLRRYYAHLLVANARDNLAIMNFEKEILYTWERPALYWRGLLCSRPPSFSYGTWNSDRCWQPSFMRVEAALQIWDEMLAEDVSDPTPPRS